MGATAPSERSRRGQIVLVQAESVDLRLGDDIAPRVQIVANLYEAVGAVASAPGSRPIEAVIIDAPTVRHPLEMITKSIRRLDPTVLLYLTVGHEDDALADSATLAGFDGLLVAPLTGYMLSALLGEKQSTEAARPLVAQAANVIDDKPSASSSDVSATATHPSSESVSAAGDAIGGLREAAAALGDIDLVEQLLRDPTHFAATAISVVRQQIGTDDVVLQPARSDGANGADVEFGGTVYGRLVSSTAEAETLQPWADWLARWLALADRLEDLERMSFTDPLTGAWNRRYFDQFLPDLLARARDRRRAAAIMVFDVDELKHYNEKFGHEAGDIVLVETVRLLRSIIRDGDRVCRIGGDEFVVIFSDESPPRKPGSAPLDSAEQLAHRFQRAICEMKSPKLGPEAPGTLSISAGLATFPWDGHDAETLLRAADLLAMESKRRGKNKVTVGKGAAAACR